MRDCLSRQNGGSKPLSTDPGKQSLLLVHVSALLLGFLAPALKVIPASASAVVFGRSLIQCIALGILMYFTGRTLALRNARDIRSVMLLGSLQALQWWTFIFAVQMTSVAVALIATFTFPVWLSLFEPVFFPVRFRFRNLLSGFGILLGLALLAPDGIRAGGWSGLLSATASGFLVAVVMLVTRKSVQRISSVTINFYESVITAMLFIFFAPGTMTLGYSDWLRLAYIALFFTGLPYLLVTYSIRHLDARVVGTIVSLEPIYGIILAAVLLGEIPGPVTALGGTIVLGISLLETWLSHRADREFLEHPQ